MVCTYSMFKFPLNTECLQNPRISAAFLNPESHDRWRPNSGILGQKNCLLNNKNDLFAINKKEMATATCHNHQKCAHFLTSAETPVTCPTPDFRPDQTRFTRPYSQVSDPKFFVCKLSYRLTQCTTAYGFISFINA